MNNPLWTVMIGYRTPAGRYSYASHVLRIHPEGITPALCLGVLRANPLRRVKFLDSLWAGMIEDAEGVLYPKCGDHQIRQSFPLEVTE
jgi:hypothetical protein